MLNHNLSESLKLKIQYKEVEVVPLSYLLLIMFVMLLMLETVELS